MKRFFYILVIIISNATVISTHAQLPTQLEVVLNPVTPIIVTDPNDHSIDSNQLFYYRFIFHVSDTTNISKIHAKIGTSDGANDLVENWFTFDQVINLPNGVIGYSRDRYAISMVIGSFTWYPDIYCEVKLEDFSNNFSPQSKYQIHW